MKPKIVIVGAGGHGKVVCDAVLSQAKYEIVGFFDATMLVGTVVMNDYKVIASQNDLGNLNNFADYFIVAIGNNLVREKIFHNLNQILKPAIIIDPSAVIAKNILIGDGTVCLANSVVSVNCNIGNNVIINSGVIIDHECIIGDHVRLSIGTKVGSNSTLANSVTTQIGEIIQPFSKLIA